VEVVAMTNEMPAPLIACVNSSEDLVQLLAEYFREEGFRAVTQVSSVRSDPTRLVTFLTDLHADACIYSVSPPYDAGWQEFLKLRTAVPGCTYLVTTTNKRALDALVGPTDSLEIIGKPYDLDQVVAAVQQALAQQHA
jgi:DNA-binding NtrC family response regulator